ncbi:pyridoxamine 5'-phosphate oxidase [Cladochytrium replicatum]|nr:pyridoxamine 5'-phosphate oxidase [Cladochytrium replicatum]
MTKPTWRNPTSLLTLSPSSNPGSKPLVKTLQLPNPTQCISTVSPVPPHRPSSRTVALKDVDPRGFVFFTNYGSRKGREAEGSGFAGLVFWWGQRQVRVEGSIVRVSEEETDAYFALRPRSSQIGQHVSLQSEVVEGGRATLDERERLLMEQCASGDVPRSVHWGAYSVVTDKIEFWQRRECRLHDRLLFTRHTRNDEWRLSRLFP